MTGNAAVEAAQKARRLLDEAVSEHLEVSRNRLSASDGRIFDSENPEKFVPFDRAVQLAEAKFGTLGTVGSYKPPSAPGKYKGAGVGPSPTYSYTACVAQVNVDVETGILHVEKIWIAHDIGCAINPLLSIGQVEGSVYMGLGEALMEEQEFRLGVHKAPSMLDYKSPTSTDMCEVVTYLIEHPDPEGPFGAKEAGQGPLLPVPPAVANALYDAAGVRIDEIPITPEKILKAIRARELGKESRYGPADFPSVPYPQPRRVPPPWEGGDGRAIDDPSHRPQMRGD